MKVPAKDLPIKAFASVEACDAWLSKHHADSKGLWVKLAKKAAKVRTRSITYPELVLVGLTWGWIDGQARPVDEQFWLVRFTPRGPRSIWSKLNRERVAKLTAEGRMKEPGLLAVANAKANGQWDKAYDSPRTMEVPPDFARALSKKPKAKSQFAKLNGANRYAVLHRIQTAIKPETRQRRITELVAMLDRGELIHPPTPKKT
jgi:uncharacterized protein YdeI (YjbR/CyaY-like superfamily)